MVLKLKGLEHIIGLSIVHPTWQKTKPNDEKDEHYGWTFGENGVPFKNPKGYGEFTFTDLKPDTLNHAKCIRDLYELSDLEYAKSKGRFSVPVLWDTKTKKK